ncbi:MAG: flagellar biosynthetic protein FliO [Roseburia sp.]|nr:flagellar biosynthetic protein FliO [Roseburia sp.]
MLLSLTTNSFDSVVQLLTVILIFIFVLVLTYFVTKLSAGIQKGRMFSPNMEILETFKIAPTKYIQVVRIGEKYFSYVVCKDTVTLLGELTKDDISEFNRAGTGKAVNVSFKEIFEKLRKK